MSFQAFDSKRSNIETSHIIDYEIPYQVRNDKQNVNLSQH